jgi:hypothetical protein
MYIEIKAYLGDDEFSEVYERATASSIEDAEGEIARIGRHYAKDVIKGKFNEPDRTGDDYEAREGRKENQTEE